MPAKLSYALLVSARVAKLHLPYRRKAFQKCFAFAFLLGLLSVAWGIITLMEIVIQPFSNKFERSDFLFPWGSE